MSTIGAELCLFGFGDRIVCNMQSPYVPVIFVAGSLTGFPNSHGAEKCNCQKMVQVTKMFCDYGVDSG